MSKKYLFSLLVLSILLLPSAVFAETKSASSSAKTPAVERRLAQETLIKEKQASKAGEIRQKIASKEANMKEKVASRVATLKDKLAAFKDKRKVAAVERISTNLTNVNQRRTSQMMKHVDTLMGILTRAEEHVVSGQAAGSDVSAVTTELGLSKTALANAKVAVEVQSKKTYEIQVASESGIRADAKESRDMLEADLKATHGLVKEARRVLINALVKLSQTMGGGTPTNESN